MKTVILRPAAIYGPGDPERFFMIFKRVAKGSFPMFGKGKTFYHPLYIDNLVDAFLLAMQEGVGDGGTYLIADEEYVEIKDPCRPCGEGNGCGYESAALPDCSPHDGWLLFRVYLPPFQDYASDFSASRKTGIAKTVRLIFPARKKTSVTTRRWDWTKA